MSALITFKGVSKSFPTSGGNLEVIKDVNLEVSRGEIVTLVGPSGCGKSTLLNMSAGLFEPTSGSVLYEGRAVAGLNAKVGYMTQSDHLLPWRTVAGNVRAPLEIRGVSSAEASKRTAELLEQVGLSGFSGSYPGQISGGMKKRTALARLLAYDPQTLLMDEPFGALDAQLRMRLQSELRVLCKRLGKTVLFVTHDLDEAVAIGDRCVVFTARPGRIINVQSIPLSEERNLLKLRFDPLFIQTGAEIWSYLAEHVEADKQ